MATAGGSDWLRQCLGWQVAVLEVAVLGWSRSVTCRGGAGESDKGGGAGLEPQHHLHASACIIGSMRASQSAASMLPALGRRLAALGSAPAAAAASCLRLCAGSIGSIAAPSVPAR